MPAQSLPFGLKRFTIGVNWPIIEVPTYAITAKNADQAWAKFCCQRFGVLKPDRSEWYVTESGGAK